MGRGAEVPEQSDLRHRKRNGGPGAGKGQGGTCRGPSFRLTEEFCRRLLQHGVDVFGATELFTHQWLQEPALRFGQVNMIKEGRDFASGYVRREHLGPEAPEPTTESWS